MAAGNGTRIEPGAKRVRGFLGGRVVVDSCRPVLVWEKRRYPTYYFPISDVAGDLLRENGKTEHHADLGTAVLFDLEAGTGSVADAAYRYAKSPIEELRGHLAFRWAALDHWFEEDEEVFFHPRNPNTRIDILHSSRHVRVEIDGVTVAESFRPTLLFETGLPVRFYLPKTHVRLDLLTQTDHATSCPYKGTARYWNVTIGDAVHQNIVWGYDTPLRESAGIAALVCFYNERVDLFVDGELQERPVRK